MNIPIGSPIDVTPGIARREWISPSIDIMIPPIPGGTTGGG
jgi:hypothetical protein